MLDNEIFFSAILDDRKWKLRKWKKRLSVPTYWTIPESFKTIHWTISEKTVGQKEKKTRYSLGVMRRSSVSLLLVSKVYSITPNLKDLSSLKISWLYLSQFLRKWKANFWISHSISHDQKRLFQNPVIYNVYKMH